MAGRLAVGRCCVAGATSRATLTRWRRLLRCQRGLSGRRGAGPARQSRAAAGAGARRGRRGSPLGTVRAADTRRSIRNAFVTTAKGPLAQAEALYRDVATQTGVRWELLAACDWMQCEAQPRYSPVHGERLGHEECRRERVPDKAEALMQCADELIDLAWAVYHIDLTAGRALSVRSLASVFAAFRWGGLLRLTGSPSSTSLTRWLA